MRNRHGYQGSLEGGVAPPLPAAASRSPARWINDSRYFWIIALFFWLIFYSGLPSNLDGFASHASFADPNPIDRFIKIGMIGLAGYFIVMRWRLSSALFAQLNPGLTGYVLFAFASLAWSIDFQSTLMRLISLLSVLMMCFAVGLASWHSRRFQQISLPPAMMILLASLVIGVVDYRMVIEAGQDLAQKDAWHGVTHSKNEFGMLSSFTVIICANALLTSRGGVNTILWGGAALIAETCVLLSRSNTSMFASTFSLLSMFVLMKVPFVVQRFTKQYAIGVAAVILMYEMIIQNVITGLNVLLAPVLGLTGKDATFSARTTIWRVVKDHIALSPYWGSGYGAYWVGPVPSSPSYVFMHIMYIYPTESHNGYLEVVNDLGLIGLAILLVFIVFYIRQALQLMRYDRSQAAMYLALLVQEMAMDMSESEWFSHSDTFAIFALSSILLSRALLDVRLKEGLVALNPSYGPGPGSS
jgi:exopolysaccharide production protein ExoQ